jgi:hypothetical protein
MEGELVELGLKLFQSSLDLELDASLRYANFFHLCPIALVCFYRVVDRIL